LTDARPDERVVFEVISIAPAKKKKRVYGQIITFERPARSEKVRTVRVEGSETSREYQVQGNLSKISLSQHRDQENLGDGRAAVSTTRHVLGRQLFQW